MKVLRTGWLWVTLVTLLIVAGCAGSQEPTPVPTATKPPAATPTSTPSGQATPTPTKATGVSTPTAAPAPTATPIPTPVPTLTPKRGGIVRVDQNRDMVGFDPNNTTSGFDNQLNSMFYNGLVWNCFGTDVCPDIAKSWKYTADGKALVFELNNNVKWQKGVKDGVVKAQDVKFSFDKIMGKVEGFTQSERIGWMTNYVTSIDVVDDFTVRFNVVRPAAILPVMMTVGFASVIPAGTTYDQMKTSKVPLGSGPFMIK
ncbi:MAG: hypothetical protein HY680_01715, partial [Chloroflexi bacterium]|nr:hypothetical protein [Chloroflexota bacterium]